ncbi:hypothetical protein MWU49_01190 [Alcanivorax sp. S6407]|uniref:hypothetical protein n=1 Tax=Alcanivorax sp. S6407 TaxID=2926424 RepID=UPI001FF2A6A3|nr:hypothetical protein [Alcanivorax sp. S6407]MCK0152305.1 hypothetical protein [Alcanivorax sp. S6407]
MLRVLSLCSVLVLTGCASTGMYDAPSGDGLAALSIDNQLSVPADDAADSGWQMPTSSEAKASLFKVDGERISEQAGAESVELEAGKHSIEVFADQGGILRFGKFRYNFVENGTYELRIKAADGAEDYTLELIETSAPDAVLKTKNF